MTGDGSEPDWAALDAAFAESAGQADSEVKAAEAWFTDLGDPSYYSAPMAGLAPPTTVTARLRLLLLSGLTGLTDGCTSQCGHLAITDPAPAVFNAEVHRMVCGACAETGRDRRLYAPPRHCTLCGSTRVEFVGAREFGYITLMTALCDPCLTVLHAEMIAHHPEAAEADEEEN